MVAIMKKVKLTSIIQKKCNKGRAIYDWWRKRNVDFGKFKWVCSNKSFPPYILFSIVWWEKRRGWDKWKEKREQKDFSYLAKKNGRTYVYLVRAIYKNQKKKNIPLFSFGRLEDALNNLYDWREDFEQFPPILTDLGFTWEDLHDWILTLETGYSKYGRKLCIAK